VERALALGRRSRLGAECIGGIEAVPRAAEIVDPQSHMLFCHFLLVALLARRVGAGQPNYALHKDAASSLSTQHSVTQRSRWSGLKESPGGAFAHLYRK